MTRIAPFLSLSLLLALTVACEAKDKSAKAKKAPAKTAAAAVKKAEKPAAKSDAKKDDGSHPECVGRLVDSPEERFDVSGLSFVRKGAVLTVTTSDPDDEFRVGQLTDVKDYSAENAANIKVALDFFKAEEVDAIAITGDIGESAEAIEKTVALVAEAGLPVMTMAGNRECREHFTAGIKAAQSKHKNVINMNTVRVVNFDDASFVSLPGYYNKDYIHCQEGCEYTPGDVQGLSKLAEKASGQVRVLLSHGPPRMVGPTGLDRIHEEANVGDPKLAEFLKSGAFPFGLFGNIQEAGGYATDLTGQTRVKQDTFADSLYLNPGPIDAVRWAMLDGSESLGMAGVVHFKGKQARYKVRRIKEGEAKVKAP